jgi:hypothetical protein
MFMHSEALSPKEYHTCEGAVKGEAVKVPEPDSLI